MIFRKLPGVLSVLLALLPLASIDASTQARFDVIIRGGRLLDGSGNPFYYGDLAVNDGRIAKLGRLGDATAQRVIDASGMFVTPGFIDMHAHPMLNYHDPDLRVDRQNLTQGITTVLLNPDGGWDGSLWPIGEHLDAYRNDGVSLNVLAMVAHGEVRRMVMGQDVQRLASPEEQEKMKALVRQGMQEGAYGLSTGLEGAPGRWSDTHELIELAKEVAPYGGFYHAHQRSEGISPRWWNASMPGNPVDGIEATLETIEIAEKARLPAVGTHAKAIGTSFKGAARTMARLMREARERGVEVYWDTYAYESYGGRPTVALVPTWALVNDGVDIGGQDSALAGLYEEPFANAKENLRSGMEDLETRYKIRRDIQYEIEKGRGAENLLILDHPNESFVGKTVHDIAMERGGEDPIDTILFLQMSGDARPGGGSYRAMNVDEEDIREVIRQDFTMYGTDGGSIPFEQGSIHPRFYGTFPRIIRKYVLTERVITLPQAIRQMTSLPATVLRLKDRGLLREGYWADITVFDPVTIRDRSTYVNPHVYSEGIRYVLINGELAVDQGEVTERLPGVVLTPPEP